MKILMSSFLSSPPLQVQLLPSARRSSSSNWNLLWLITTTITAGVIPLLLLFFVVVVHHHHCADALLLSSSSSLSSSFPVVVLTIKRRNPLSTTSLSVAAEDSIITTTTTTTQDIIINNDDDTTSTTSRDDDSIDDSQHQHPISLDFDMLTKRLQASDGRSHSVWDCYRLGIDPILFHDSCVEESKLDECVTTIIENSNIERNNVKVWTRDELRSLIKPKRRRNQGLGKGALDLMGCKPIEESIATISEISISKDSTTKLLVKLLEDGLEVETVIIPWKETGKSTLCISSQVGCKQGCTFCATGKMGKLRDLSTTEILVQVYLAIKTCRVLNLFKIDGIVYMGMGDAADNSDSVIESAKILTNQNQFQFKQRKVTISTIGPTPESFIKLSKASTSLAWSVHATNDNLRRQLVPTTKYTMDELKIGFLHGMKQRPMKLRTAMLEIVLISNINDSIDDADHLVDFVTSMIESDIIVEGIKVMVNLIPYNDIGGSHRNGQYKKPTQSQLMIFQSRLTSRGIKCFIRTTRGDEESSACGQLATTKTKTNKKKKKKNMLEKEDEKEDDKKKKKKK